jgi:hypothetical protein
LYANRQSLRLAALQTTNIKGYLMKKPIFSLTVSNVGAVLRDAGKRDAYKAFREYCETVDSDKGRMSGETVTIWQDGEPIKEYAPQFFFVEFTDTYGGEANYCWVDRYRVKANSLRQALTKAKKERYYSPLPRHIVTGDYGDSIRADMNNAAVCAFVDFWEAGRHEHMKPYKEIL